MNTSRLEAFSDGVIAIILTIMVLELKVPHSPSLVALKPLFPVFLVYIMSFIYVGIYWNNHHHLFHATKRVNGGMLWANLHLLFWLSLIPFVTGWMGENHFTTIPTMMYGFVLLMAAIAYYILQNVILRTHKEDSQLRKALSRDLKGKLSPVLYVIAIITALFSEPLSAALYASVALIWLVPDRRIEKMLASREKGD
ncbi:MAG TPA: TMEM175 family protein [Alphaproteobacteria bacterium]